MAVPCQSASQTTTPFRTPESGGRPLLVVMTPTGQERDGRPVYTPHPNGAPYEALLTRGFAGRLLRLFRYEQEFLAQRGGTSVEPAYLLLSRNEGGFPRFGFWLDGEDKRGVGYVDLHERLGTSGRFGALDQIFPHELMHVIVHQLAAPPPAGASGANQVHAIGVRTDRVTAFDEGFAEHAQVMAVDDADAQPLTAALRGDAGWRENAAVRLQRYERALDARWGPAPPARMSFILWFSQTEQVLRYHGVKANRFAHDPAIRLSRFSADDLYAAYLLDNVIPGDEAAPVKSTPRLLATEGVIAALFSRWVTDPTLQQPASDPAMYARFGTSAGQVAPLEHAYLKLFSVLADRQPHDAAGVVHGYVASFPGEVDAVAALLQRTGFVWPLPDVPEIWLANDRFMTGTTVFDQYRALPRIHTFDLNAASIVDVLTIDGISLELATAIRTSAPYASLDDLRRVPGVTSALTDRLRTMQRGMTAVREANAMRDIEQLNLATLFRSLLIRVLIWSLVCLAGSAMLYRTVRPARAWRLLLNGLGIVAFGLLPAWVLGSTLQIGSRPVDPTWFTLLPAVMFGLPAAVWQVARYRRSTDATRALAAWMLACLPVFLITTPMF